MGQDSSQTGQADYYLAQVSSASLYYPFGWEMPGRKFVSGEEYRFGFNGQEEDPDMGVVFKYRVHDARVGRFLSVDPLAPEYPWNSCYAFAENRVIEGIDLEGLESSRTTDKQFTAPADPKLGVPAVDGISYNVPNLQVEFELKEAQRESAQKSLYNSNKAYIGPFTAEMKRRMALQREAKQQLEASQNPIILLGQFGADGFWTVYDGSMAAYNYSQGDISKGNIHLMGFVVPGVSGEFLKSLKYIEPGTFSKDMRKLVDRSGMTESSARKKIPEVITFTKSHSLQDAYTLAKSKVGDPKTPLKTKVGPNEGKVVGFGVQGHHYRLDWSEELGVHVNWEIKGEKGAIKVNMSKEVYEQNIQRLNQNHK